ncbi:MAG TPA: PAS domain-containing sensor histidine kinase [Usitatibacter sp.]|nr:PAS domain-containing sensor histidine kinase [Usitatibacter sp.]
MSIDFAADPASWLRMLAERSLEHAIMFITPEARIGWWSPGAAHIFGYRAEEILGEPCARLFVPEDIATGIPEQERAIALTDDAAEDDRWQQRKDGSRFWASGILVSLKDAEGRLLGFGKVLRDRTDLKEQIEGLRAEVRDLQGVNGRKDVFLATLSHELRNPLAPLANAVRLIRLSPAYRSEFDYPLKVIERQMGLLQRLVDDILDVARVDTGKIVLQPKPLLLGEVLRNAVDATAAAVQARGHRLELVLPEGPIPFEGDPDRLHQVFTNLITNAVKYTPAGGRIWVKGTVEGEDIVARVEDNGEGIAPEMLPRIFELFVQVDTSRAHSKGGLGIGLAVVRELVALHGGSVQVKSEGHGKGSEFTVRLPPRLRR